jgi:hypothetical protein
MNNLYRDLAPITEVAWGEIETEATRTFKRHIAGCRVVDVSEPGGPTTAAVSTGHLLDVGRREKASSHTCARAGRWFGCGSCSPSRTDIDDVERGSQDSDWDPVKEAARQLAFAEDRAIFEGYEAASIGGIRSSSNPALALPPILEIPTRSQALSELRLAGVDGRTACCCPRTSMTGQRDHRARLSDSRPPEPADRDHLGARDRRRVRAVYPRRRPICSRAPTCDRLLSRRRHRVVTERCVPVLTGGSAP